MTEKDLILKIKQLKEIKPREEWVDLTRQRIMAELPEVSLVTSGGKATFADVFENLRFIFNYKFALASITAVFLFTGFFSFAQNSVPGDPLFIAKKGIEKVQGSFLANKDYDLKIVNNRLDDIVKIAEKNETRKIAPAINEYQESVSRVAKNIVKNETRESQEEVKKVTQDIKKIEGRVEGIRSLGIQINENFDLDSALVVLVTDQATELESKELTNEQIVLLGEVKTFIENGKYVDALEQILTINQDLKNEQENKSDIEDVVEIENEAEIEAEIKIELDSF